MGAGTSTSSEFESLQKENCNINFRGIVLHVIWMSNVEKGAADFNKVKFLLCTICLLQYAIFQTRLIKY
jgi:hypothetical protein